MDHVQKRKLLLADDSVTIQKVINLTFADEGIDVVTVGDGDSAMVKIAEERPDVVLADVNMPGLTGYQICEALRQREETRELPVILLAGSFEPFDEEEAARVGANAFLTKPFHSIRQLVSQVADLMPKEAAVPPGPIDEHQEPAPQTGDFNGVDEINDLYHRSLGGTERFETAAVAQPEYLDAGMDDEMIEAEHLSSEQEEQTQAAFQEHPESIEASENETATAFEQRAPSPFEELAREEPEDHRSPDVNGTMEVGFEDLHAPAAPEQHFDTETDSREFERSSAAEHFETEVHQFADAEGATAQAASEGHDLNTDRAEAIEFDEVDLLELPPVGSGKSLEFTTPEAAAAKGSNTQAVSLSPELLDIIVQRVVEKLSEKY